MPRIRAYFALIAARHFLFGLVIWTAAERLVTAPALQTMISIAPLRSWAVMMWIVGVLCIGGVLWPREMPMRLVVVLSIVVTAALAATMLLAIPQGSDLAAVFAVLLFGFVGKDTLIVGLRWRDPFARLNEVCRVLKAG